MGHPWTRSDDDQSQLLVRQLKCAREDVGKLMEHSREIIRDSRVLLERIRSHGPAFTIRGPERRK